MGLTTAMNTGATGLNSNSTILEVIGDNLANVNTNAFKSNRADLETQFALTLRDAAGPGNGTGGVNPSQIGLGSQVGAIQRSFLQGAISPTGSPSDLAIDGQGFFILESADDESFYTRDGAFTLDVNNQLVSRDGLSVQGFLADALGNVDSSGATTGLTIPLGTMTQVQATTTASVDGNLNGDAAIAVAGQVLTSAVLNTAGGVADTGTSLTELVDTNGNVMFAEGDVIEVSGVLKGGFEMPAEQFVVGSDGNSIQDFMNFLQDVFAINADATLGENAGITMSNGSMVINSNWGQSNAIEIEETDIRNTTAGAAPFSFTVTTEAVGGGTTTSFLAYDSLGSAVEVRLRLELMEQNELGSTWRYYAESADDSDQSNLLGTGTISFDQNGRFIASTGDPLNINLAGSGATDPLSITMDFSRLTGLASGSESSEVRLFEQDGKPFGILVDFAIDEKGMISGSFTNGLTATLGQVALATFSNQNGLKLVTDNNFIATENSGEARIAPPKTDNAGRLQSGALELSNVDLAREFIGLINASAGFSASSRVITAADELFQELLLIAR